MEVFDVEGVVIIFLFGGIGLICSIGSIYLITKKSILHNAYGIICATHSFFEGIILFIFIFWTAALVFIDKTLDKSLFGIILGVLINLFFYITQYLHLFKSINRFFAIVFYVKYRIFFTNKITFGLILIAFILSFAHIIPYFSHECNYYFNSQKYIWSIRGSCPIAFYLDIGNCSVTMCISFSCDITTFCYLYFGLHKKTASLKSDIKFLIQAFSSSLFYLCTMFSFHIFSKFANTVLLDFLTITLAWMLCHTLNQVSFILFTVCGYRKASARVSVHIRPTNTNSAISAR